MRKICVALFCLCLLAGCARQDNDPNTVTVWHWMTDRDDALHELADRYKQKTGVNIKIDLFAPSDVYSKKVTTSAQAKILPDIFGILDTKTVFSKFVKYGYIADLTADFEKNDGEWKGLFFEKALDSNRFGPGNTYGVKPGIYGVPLDVTTIQMLYNRKLLKTAGHDSPPKTFAEFIEVSRDLKRVGIAGMVSGWGEVWLVECFASNYAFNIMGEDKIMATYRGEVPYTDPEWIKVFDIFRQLVDHHMLAEGVVAKPNKEAEQDFALERAAFAFNGSWGVNVYHDMNPGLDYGVMLPPAVDSQYPMKIWGGAGSSFVVNDRSARKEKAVAFLRWLTDKEQQEFLATETNNLPSNRSALSAVPEVLEDFARGMNDATHPTIWPLIEQPVVSERFGKGLQAIMLKQKTPEQVAREIQEVKTREMARAVRRRE